MASTGTRTRTMTILYYIISSCYYIISIALGPSVCVLRVLGAPEDEGRKRGAQVGKRLGHPGLVLALDQRVEHLRVVCGRGAFRVVLGGFGGVRMVSDS